MSERFSLADQMVSALAAVQRMDADVTNEHGERHYIRSLKRLAEQALESASRYAQDMAFLAQQIHDDADAARAALNNKEQAHD